MNNPPRQTERIIRLRGAGAAEVRPADLGGLNRQRGRVPTAEYYQTHPAKLPGQKDFTLYQYRGQILLPGERRSRISAIENR